MKIKNKQIMISVFILTLALVAIVGLDSTLVPLLFSFSLAYLIFPLIIYFESKGVHRKLAIVGVLMCMALFSAGALALIVPKLVSETKSLIRELPSNAEFVVERIEEFAAGYGYVVDLSKQGVRDFLEENTSAISADMIKNFSKTLKGAFSGVLGWILGIINLFLIPLFFFYLVSDFEKINKSLRSLVPVEFRSEMDRFFELCHRVFKGFFRGQILVALILAILYSVGLSIVGLKFGLLIGLVSGLISIIPYAGFTIGFGTALIVSLANNSGSGVLVGVICVFLIVQTLEGIVITPKLVGDQVGLSALATMLALIIGGNLFGVFGMLIAIPMAAIIQSILKELIASQVNE